MKDNKININVAAEQFKTELFSLINSAGRVLPPALINYILANAYHEVYETYQEYISSLQITSPQAEEQDVPAEGLDENA